MARTNMKPIVLFFLKLLIGLSAPKFIAGNENQQFLYSGFASANLTLDGTASITPSGLLELTNGTAMSMGHAFYPAPLRLRDSPNGTIQSFSASFVFGIISVYDLSSQGLTMLIAPSKDFTKAMPVQYLGLVNSSNNGNTTNHIFAIELDTWQQLEFGDINNNHIGVDINGLRSLHSYPAGFFDDQNGTFKNLTLSSQEAMQVWVDYDKEKIQIDVTMAPLDVATRPERPTVSARYNLSVVLKDVAYIGFSSSTGRIDTRHYVLGWSFAMNGPAPAFNLTMLPKLPRHHPKGSRYRVLQIVLPVGTAVLLLSLGTITFLLVQRHFRYAEVRDNWEVEFGPHRFSYKDLYHATGGFEEKNLLGVGGFGRVYKGVLPRSRLKIAVKRVSHDSKQGMKEFIAEIVSIGRLQNRNLVPLLGYCRRKDELLLVYQYMPNGSLDKYLAPELARSGNATPPTDVFAFGMFVLEVTCGQRPCSFRVVPVAVRPPGLVGIGLPPVGFLVAARWNRGILLLHGPPHVEIRPQCTPSRSCRLNRPRPHLTGAELRRRGAPSIQ